MTTTLLAGGALLVLGVGYKMSHPQRVPEQASTSLATPVPSASAPVRLPDTTSPAELVAASASAPTDDRLAPPLPEGAPGSVSFGVVLVAYRGAEGAPSGARSKEEALRKARELVQVARTAGFETAVGQGDRGSTPDAGKMPRGVLEASVEYSLFTLKIGEVYGEPVDTPRGFWVLRRNQ
jgi:hypothetical protein